jgi:drug/metabolite transporter (DMT)-like permease
MNKQIFSAICALATSFIWGSAFVAQDMGMDNIGPYTFNFSRLFVGFLGLIPFFFIFEFKKIKQTNLDLKKNIKIFFNLRIYSRNWTSITASITTIYRCS